MKIDQSTQIYSDFTIAEISRELGMSTMTVCKIIRKFQERLAENVIMAGFEIDDFSRRE